MAVSRSAFNIVSDTRGVFPNAAIAAAWSAILC
jgi:hypothetical protein